MALATMLYNTIEKNIGGITVDAFISEEYSFENEVTELPIEDGATITDNIIPIPYTINLQGFFGKFEFNANDSMSESKLQTLSSNNNMERVKFYFNELLRLKNTLEPITIVTGLDTFENMVITSLNIPRDVENGGDLNFTMTLKHLPIIQSETVKMSVSNVSKNTAKDTIQSVSQTGVQSKQEADENAVKQIHKQWVKSGAMTPEEYQKRWNEPYVLGS